MHIPDSMEFILNDLNFLVAALDEIANNDGGPIFTVLKPLAIVE
jgi:hypothetical protein